MVAARRLRYFLGLTQLDVAAATGVPLGKLAAFERDRASLNAPELASLLSLYRQKLFALRVEEPDVFTFLGPPGWAGRVRVQSGLVN